MLNFDIYDLNEFVDRHNLKPSSATATITLFNLIIQTVRSIECKTKDTDNILGKIDWFLRNPDFIVYDNFVKCFELDTHHSSRDTDHSSYSFYPNQRAVFSSLVLHLVHKALARHHAKPIPESTPSLFTPVTYDEIPPDQAERLAYICGWVLMRSRQNMKCSSELIAHLGHDEQCKDNGKFYVKPNIPCLKFFHCLSNFIFGRLNMDRCHEQTSQLANLVTAEVQSNHAIHSHFKDLFPPHLCSQSITLLLQEMTRDPDISPLFISPPLFFATHNLPLSTFCHFSFRHSHFATHSLPPTFRHPRFCHSSFCHTHFATTVFATLVFANHILPLLLCWKCNCNVHSNCLSIISIH
mgnify:CR=1 FL=1